MLDESITKPAFQRNDKCLCFHGPMIYEAKILLIEIVEEGSIGVREPGVHYFVHYKGWKPSWDEWVPSTRILSFEPHNLKKQLDLKELHSANTRASAAKSSTNDKKRSAAEKEEDFLKKPVVKIVIPETLKIQLVDDWEQITNNNCLVVLPKRTSPNVTTIIAQFSQSMKPEDPVLLKEICDGLRHYFNAALPNALLYKFERQQYSELLETIKKNNSCPAELYGAEHLLRLFAQMPSIIANTSMSGDGVVILRDHFAEFLRFMETHREVYFSQGYEDASPQYIANKLN